MKSRMWRMALSSLLGLALTMGLLNDPLGAQQRQSVRAWSEPSPIFDSGTSERDSQDRKLNPQAAFGDQRDIFVVWSQTTSTGGGRNEGSEIFLARSEDDGANFSVKNLSNSSSRSSDFPDIAVSRDDIYVVWEEGEDDNGNNEAGGEIMLAVSRDEGESFDTPINVSENPDRIDRDARVIASNRIVLVVWEQVNSDEDGSDIFFTFSRDGGESFSQTRNLSSTSDTFSTSPQVAADPSIGRTFFVVWEDESSSRRRNQNDANTEIFFSSIDVSIQKAESIGRRVNVSNSQNENSLNPTLVATGGRRVAVLWEEGGEDVDRSDDERRAEDDRQQGDDADQDREIFLATSSDKGQNFTSRNISNDPSLDSRNPVVTASGSRDVFIAWEQEEGPFADEADNQNDNEGTGTTDVWFTRSDDGGETLFSAQNLSHSTGVDSRHINLTAEGRNVYLAWEEGSEDDGGSNDDRSEVLFVHSDDKGKEMISAQNLSRSFVDGSFRPIVIAKNRTVLTLWEEQTEDANNRSDEARKLVASRNTDSGARLTNRRSVRNSQTRFSTSVNPSDPAAPASDFDPAAPLSIESSQLGTAWTFQVQIPQGTAEMRLEVFDLSGRSVFQQTRDVSGQTSLQLSWPTVDSYGASVANGVYLYTVTAQGPNGERAQSEVRKLIVMR